MSEATADSALVVLRAALKSQYHAALAMLRETIERCPNDLWAGGAFINPTWHVAYHVLFYTHFYLQPRAEDFTPWKHHRENTNYFFDELPPGADSGELHTPYTKAQVMEYWRFCDDLIDAAVESLDLLSGESGFDWYPIPKLDHQIVNIRHIQHHAAQIGQRIRHASAGGICIDWVGAAKRQSEQPS